VVSNSSLADKSAASTAALYAKIAWRLMPLLFICYIVAYLDRMHAG
jgi:sugar phosphate permease